MNNEFINALKLKIQPVAIILTDDKPGEELHFKEGSSYGCIASKLVAVSKKSR